MVDQCGWATKVRVGTAEVHRVEDHTGSSPEDTATSREAESRSTVQADAAVVAILRWTRTAAPAGTGSVTVGSTRTLDGAQTWLGARNRTGTKRTPGVIAGEDCGFRSPPGGVCLAVGSGAVAPGEAAPSGPLPGIGTPDQRATPQTTRANTMNSSVRRTQ